MAGLPDGSGLYIHGLGVLDFTLPRRLRDAGTEPTAPALADIYARHGLWGWAHRLLEREAAAGRAVPVLLRARASWVCGDYDRAPSLFDDAARAGECSASYARLCASVGDEPGSLIPGAFAARGPDPDAPDASTDSVSPDAIPASDVARLRTLYGQDVTVEGRVAASAWSSTGKSMMINFTDASGGGNGMLAVLFKRDREAFDRAFDGDAAARFVGARVRITGKVENYGGYLTRWKDTPQIILDNPDQVTVLP